ncbi:MAG: hypothetical protein LBU39_01930 [Desulfobulbaceae bacterium]|jgi:hypothetical protein|nr:hypothetical protein [Desulfobulbaceae bacterium]
MPGVTLILPGWPATQPPAAIILDFGASDSPASHLRGAFNFPVGLIGAYRGATRITIVYQECGNCVLTVRPTGSLRAMVGLSLTYQVANRRACRLPLWPAISLRAAADLPVWAPAERRGRCRLPLALVERLWQVGVFTVVAPEADSRRGSCRLPISWDGGAGYFADAFTCQAKIFGLWRSLEIIGFALAASEDQYAITGQVYLANKSDLAPAGTPIVLTTPAGTFILIVDGHSLGRSISEAVYQETYSLDVISPAAALLDAPFADAVIDEFPGGMASEIAAQFVATTGVSLSWQTIDWHIPPDTLFATGETPLAVLRKLASACGAILQSQPDGTLMIRPVYPVRVTDWSTAPAQILSVDDFASSISCAPDWRDGYNAFLVGNSQPVKNDTLRLDEEAVSPAEKRILLWETPMTQARYTLYCSRPEMMEMRYDGVINKNIDRELVEFIGGQGQAERPIYDLRGIEWGAIQLGALTFTEDGALVSEVDGQSIAYISYTTKYRQWMVRDANIEDVQFWVE